jgi:hypothetical protein
VQLTNRVYKGVYIHSFSIDDVVIKTWED